MKALLLVLGVSLFSFQLSAGDGSILRASGNRVPNEYLVVLNDDVNPQEVAHALGSLAQGQVMHVWQYALKGFCIRIPELSEERAALISLDPRVKWIEENRSGQIAQSDDLRNPDLNEEDPSLAEPLFTITEVTVSSASGTGAPPVPWNIDRIDQRTGRDGSYSYCSKGLNVKIYVLDTGIRRYHDEFTLQLDPTSSRVEVGRDFAKCWPLGCPSEDAPCQNFRDDMNAGHGTAVASIAGGRDEGGPLASFGVAHQVKLVPVNIGNCYGNTTAAMVTSGIDWVAGKEPNEGAITPAIVNMSFGLPTTVSGMGAMETAINNLISIHKVTVIVSANNSVGGVDACTTSPARLPNVITVGATTITDSRWADSNYGACVDIFAPGDNIDSAYHECNNCVRSRLKSGTSFAAPHVAGVAARWLSQYPSAWPGDVWYYLSSVATNGILTNIGPGSPNRMLFAPVGRCRPA